MNTPLPSINDADLGDKAVLVRADLNAPMRDGTVTDTTRIDRFLPTVRWLAGRGARVVIMSHLGRPHGFIDGRLSLRPIAGVLSERLGRKVRFAEDCVGTAAEQTAWALRPGEVLLLENLRFHAGEEANSESFARRLGIFADIYINDAFSCAHRAHASTDAITRILPSFAGPSLSAEITALQSALDQPKRPVAAIVGGAKISTKIAVLTRLIDRTDAIVVAGGMANTFLLAQGLDVGKSLVEPDQVPVADRIIKKAARANCQIVLPVDAVVAPVLMPEAPHKVVDIDKVPPTDMILDIGPRSSADLIARFGSMATVLWNGPLGAFETEPFDRGTMEIAAAVARITRSGGLTTIAGGGDTVAALNKAAVIDDLTYVSTAGGAFLEWLEGRSLPGLAALAAQNPTETLEDA